MSGIKGRSGGHNKTTLRDKQIKGERKDRVCKNPPALIEDRIVEIQGLGEIGKMIFSLYEPMLSNNGTMSATDAIAFHMLCKKCEDWYAMSKECDEKGRMSEVIGKDGKVIDLKQAPWAKLEVMYFDQLKAMCREFGLTPVSRGCVERLEQGKDTNPFGGLTI